MSDRDIVKGLPVGASATFNREGDSVTFTIKRVARRSYCLSASYTKQRTRWGNLGQIMQDLDHCLTWGRLPRPAGPRW